MKIVLDNTSNHALLRNMINELLGSESRQFDVTNLGQKLGELRRKVSANFIIGTWVDHDEENSTRHSVYVSR